MVIYGSKATQLTKELLIDKCPNCGTQNSVELYVFQKYAHVFWIPFFPMGKTGVSQCQHCKQALKATEMPPGLKERYDTLKQQTKTPFWTFAGLALIIILVSWAVISGRQNDAKNAKLIEDPQAGDIFEIKTPEDQYTLYKVDEVRGDSVFILPNQYEANRATGLAELKRKGDDAYLDETMPFLKSELKDMLSKGIIRDIDRK